NRCFKKFECGRVTKLISPQAAEVDDILQHVKDLRCHAVSTEERSERLGSEDEDETEDDEPLLTVAPRRIGRTKLSPTQLCC
ncbi:hypothetical protein SK128_021961, partial [Halocaridina rubra]